MLFTAVRLAVLAIVLGSVSVHAGTITYGDPDCLNQGCYGVTDPTTGATLEGLLPGVTSSGLGPFAHGFPFSPGAGDYPGTDQIYVGSVQTAGHDGYSGFAGRLNGPQILVFDFSSLVGAGQTVQTLTLGLAADDFQNTVFGQPFTATINGVVQTDLTNFLNGLNQTTPVVQFFAIGLDPALDNPSHILTLQIDEGGDGGDGWAVDFATVGVTTTGAAAAPEPSSLVLLGSALIALAMIGKRWSNRSAQPRS